MVAWKPQTIRKLSDIHDLHICRVPADDDGYNRYTKQGLPSVSDGLTRGIYRGELITLQTVHIETTTSVLLHFVGR